jgi:hypothetical protein
MFLARVRLQELVAAIPSAWQDAARKVLPVRPSGKVLTVTKAMIAAAWDKVCRSELSDSGWGGGAIAVFTVSFPTLDSPLMPCWPLPTGILPSFNGCNH